MTEPPYPRRGEIVRYRTSESDRPAYLIDTQAIDRLDGCVTRCVIAEALTLRDINVQARLLEADGYIITLAWDRWCR